MSIARAASEHPRRVAPVDPGLAEEPEPSDDALRYGAGGDEPAADEISPELLARVTRIDALATAMKHIDPTGTVPDGPLGIPGVALLAYENAASHLGEAKPGCGLDWSLVAAIGRIESGHARGGRVDAAGRTIAPILGIALDGRPGIAAIADTDGGALDQDSTWDRAVGPMQFIPSTWAGYAADGNGDGVRDPHNIYDAAVATGRLLCAGGGDLRDPVQRAQAVFRYNHSDSYVATVLLWADAYARRVTPVDVPPGPGPLPPGLPDSGLIVPPAPLPPLPLPLPGPAPAPVPVGSVAPAPAPPPEVPSSTDPPPAPTTATTEAVTSTTGPTTTATSTTGPPPATTTTTLPATTTVPAPTTTTTLPTCPPSGTAPPGTAPPATQPPGTTVAPPPACTP